MKKIIDPISTNDLEKELNKSDLYKKNQLFKSRYIYS